MKVRSVLMTEMSGKLGNMVASTARGGIAYLRALVTPRNPLTFLQTAIRNALASASARWRTILTDDQRETWWDIATGGQTGQSIYTRVNQPIIFSINAGRFLDGSEDPAATPTPFDDPPADGSITVEGTIPTVTIDDSANTLALSNVGSDAPFLDTTTNPDNPALLYVYGSHQQTTSRLSRQHPYSLLGVYKFATTDSVGLASHKIDLAALGLTTETGKVMYVKTICQDRSGKVSIPAEQRITITA